ncbi:alpha/beta hydrolase [Flavitalea sp. BT771]|uniref:alpha/beta hydrolase n=1 Tax=Flavitalea sp. BT771 TaxID=3063329 RepID=UPI0026E27F62|nr:alpha/beta hydrolase [Flavitalea sp. BT771]MDO6434493.1 alpha/beta hydrolase [Flavitalea sp. BT771]MDV6223393.1 alpha/beta hydrolase [Flavitalea sp. BT771]
MNFQQKLALRYVRAKLHILSLVSPERAAKKAFQLFCTPRRKSPTKLPPLFEKGENLSFRLEDHVVRGHRWLPHQASSDSLKKALIVHGFESSSRNFEQYVGALLKKGYEVLAFDAPAHGLSGGRRITLPLYTDMIRTVYDQYGPVHAFMGHSLGALALALFLESIPHDDTTRMALIAPAVEATFAVDMFFQLLELSDEVRTAFEAYEYHLYGLPFSWFSLRRTLDKIKADILWVQDEEDTITPLKDTLPVKEERRPNIRFIITRGLGHRKIYRDMKVVQQVVAFLSEDQ